jgi:hypothetical protein
MANARLQYVGFALWERLQVESDMLITDCILLATTEPVCLHPLPHTIESLALTGDFGICDTTVEILILWFFRNSGTTHGLTRSA